MMPVFRLVLAGIVMAALLVSACGVTPTATPRPVNLAGSQWTLAALGAPGAETAALPGTTVTLVWGADGRVGGSAGCNNYSGGYTITGSKLSLSPLASTKMFCAEPQGVSEQETRYLTALQSAVSFQVQGSQLFLYDAGGQQVLRLQRS